MALTYDDAGDAYNSSTRLYDGLAIVDDATLVVSGASRNAEMLAEGPSITVGTHGSSLGTLDVGFLSYAPATDAEVYFLVLDQLVFAGLVKTVDVEDIRTGLATTIVQVSAQDAGPTTDLPTAAPFNVSDTPNFSTTFPYVNLTKKSRTTEGGAVKVTYMLTVDKVGLWVNQNIFVTSAIHGLSAVEFQIVEATLSFQTTEPLSGGSPRYVLTLGEPLVQLEDVVDEISAIAPGEITETEISDGAISTPKLAANAVTTDKLDANAVVANLLNVGGTVEIDADGITVTDGSLMLTNSGGTVVIDGQSNMFKIAATGTLSGTKATGSDGMVGTVTLTGLGTLAEIPAHTAFIGGGADPTLVRALGATFSRTLKYAATSSGGAVTSPFVAVVAYSRVRIDLDASPGQVRLELWIDNHSGSDVTQHARYYVFQEVGM